MVRADSIASTIEWSWRWLASSALSDQSIPASGLAPKRMNSRTVSAPYLSTISPGLTVFPSDLPIFTERVPRLSPQAGQSEPNRSTWNSALQSEQNGAGALSMPWQTRVPNGSPTVFISASRVTLVKNRAYRRCMTACSIPPM